MNGVVAALRAEVGTLVANRPDVPTRAARPRSDGGALAAVRRHWPEYLIEAQRCIFQCHYGARGQ